MSDWQRVKSIFEELVERPEGQRAEALERLCDGDAALRAAVSELLSADERAGTFLREPTLRGFAPESGGMAFAGAVELPPRIGGYTPLEVVGEGGFGTVYRARQEEPVRRIVALKVIKPGMDSREVIARFEGERQALALMNHPNIAAVYDAGATEHGRPYFVMEYVPGAPITDYCRRRGLDLHARLELFQQVCRAVQHAHQKGIIHRDIKPSNVLVVDATAEGGSGDAIVKVIDFGVAKAIEQRLTEHTAFTQPGGFIGTPAYMSPEQAELGRPDIDTRTDVYSLGVLLYELLTGSPPFDPQSLLSKGYAEAQRIIREVEPPRPSTRLGRSAAQSAADGAPGPHGAAECRALIRRVRGDLDWIVMKCLEKDRAQRYESANDIALEIDRYLRDEPVLAGPPTVGYRLRKFARRNRAALVAVTAIAAALLIGLTLSLVGFVAAVRARDAATEQGRLARRAAQKAEAVNRFMQEMLASADPRHSAQREMTVREALDRAVAALDAGSLSEQPEVEAAVRLTISHSYLGVARFDEAEAQADAAVRLSVRLSGAQSAEYAAALHQRGAARKFARRAAEAEADLRAALAVFERLGEPVAENAAACANDLALTLLDQGKDEEGGRLLKRVLKLAREPRNADKPIRGEAVNNMGSLYLAQKDYASAAPLFREAIDVNRRILGEFHPNVATNLDNLAQTLHGLGDVAGARAAYEEALAIRRRLFGSDHPDVATSLHNLAVLQYTLNDLEGSERSLRESLAIFRRTLGLAHGDTLTAVHSLVSVLGARQEYKEIEALLREAFDAARGNPLLEEWQAPHIARRLAQLYEAWGRPGPAAEWSGRADELAPAADNGATTSSAGDPADVQSQ